VPLLVRKAAEIDAMVKQIEERLAVLVAMGI